ncbi:hypothetical protein BKA81DRAFT_373351 [Phyllosticta paracitricarpa]
MQCAHVVQEAMPGVETSCLAAFLFCDPSTTPERKSAIVRFACSTNTACRLRSGTQIWLCWEVKEREDKQHSLDETSMTFRGPGRTSQLPFLETYVLAQVQYLLAPSLGALDKMGKTSVGFAALDSTAVGGSPCPNCVANGLLVHPHDTRIIARLHCRPGHARPW